MSFLYKYYFLNELNLLISHHALLSSAANSIRSGTQLSASCCFPRSRILTSFLWEIGFSKKAMTRKRQLLSNYIRLRIQLRGKQQLALRDGEVTFQMELSYSSSYFHMRNFSSGKFLIFPKVT